MRTLFVSGWLLLKRSLLVLASLVATAPVTAALANSPADEGNVTAVWKPQQLNFEYRSDGTTYSCRSLEDKLTMILRTVGAHQSMQLSSYVCNEQLRLARFQVSMQSPVIASEENIREITTHDAKDELIARVNGAQLASAADLERFPAVWKQVSFSRDRRLGLERGDCELVQQVRRQILPRMSVQVVKDNLGCSSSLGNVGPPRLTVSALVPAEPKLR